jgi:hypothetical protein
MDKPRFVYVTYIRSTREPLLETGAALRDMRRPNRVAGEAGG